MDQDFNWGLNTSTTSLQVLETTSTPPAKRRRPEVKASRGGREAAAGAARGSDKADCDHAQEWEGNE